jgi:hypothetical protein
MKTLESILEVKAMTYEIVKDSPLLLYLAFYEPLHSWLISVADGWNPVLKFFLNILMVIYGVFRVAVIIKNWDKNPKIED